jgi:hypothetical protein
MRDEREEVLPMSPIFFFESSFVSVKNEEKQKKKLLEKT